jgi:myo-inositol catabolism protein IolS
MRALTDLKDQGKIRAIGVSNFSLDQLKTICEIGPIESLQPPYSLLWRHVETDTLAWCREQRVTILAYSPMAQGLLTGKFGPDHQFEKGDHRNGNRLFHKDGLPACPAGAERPPAPSPREKASAWRSWPWPG